jgi:hypothetical protein
MIRKTLGACILLLGLLLGTSSSASADTISMTSVSVSSIQLTSTSGTIVFLGPQFGNRAGAFVNASNTTSTGLFQETSNVRSDPTRAETTTSITFANAAGLSDFTNSLVSANANIMLSGCVCTAMAEAGASLRDTFMITGGTGSVDVTFSALLQTMQSLVTDQFSVFAASDATMNFQVAGVDIFSLDSRLSIGPNGSVTLEMQRQLSQVLTLQFGQQYTLGIFVRANSRGAHEIPEPATVVLLVSGLGFMARVVKKRRARYSHP